jgi:hypothetical protein
MGDLVARDHQMVRVLRRRSKRPGGAAKKEKKAQPVKKR